MRIAKIFISSTFNDMQKERDILSRRVFPALANAYRVKNIWPNEIDLRWGLTRTMARNEGAVSICLDEIEDCTPLVLGILGSRVGWTPATQDPRVNRHACSSPESVVRGMTEIELTHAINLGKTAHPVHLPRILRRSNRCSEALGNDTTERDAMNAALIRLESQSGQKALVYDSLKEFETKAKKCLIDALETWIDSPERIKPPKQRFFLPRKKLLKKLERTVQTRKPTLIMGDRGVGKTELCRHWLTRLNKATIEIDGKSDRLERLAVKIANSVDTSTATEETVDVFRRHSLHQSFEHVKKDSTVLIDHFDALFHTAHHSDLSIFPNKVARGVRLVVVSSNERIGRIAENMKWSVIRIPELTESEIAEISNGYLSDFSKTLETEDLATLLRAPWSSKPGPLVLALNELRRFGFHGQLRKRAHELASCTTETALAAEVIDGIQRSLLCSSAERVNQLLVSLTLTSNGLFEYELLQAANHGDRTLDASDWAAIKLGLGYSLSSTAGRVDISSEPLRARAIEIANENPELLRQCANSVASVLHGEPRRSIELPGIKYAGEGSEGLLNHLRRIENTSALLKYAPVSLEGWLDLLDPTQKSQLCDNWIDTIRRMKNPKDFAWIFANLAAYLEIRESAIALLKLDEDYKSERKRRLLLSVLLNPNHESLQQLKFSVLNRKSEYEPEHTFDAASVVVSGGSRGFVDIANNELKELMRIFVSSGSKRSELSQVIPILDCARIYLRRSKFWKANRYIKRAEKLARKYGHARMLGETLERKTTLLIERNKFSSARETAVECLRLARDSRLHRLESLAYEHLIRVECKTARWVEYHETLQEYLERSKEINARSRAEALFGELEEYSRF